MPELAERLVMAGVREQMVERPMVLVEEALEPSSLEQAATPAAAAEVIPLPEPAKRATGER